MAEHTSEERAAIAAYTGPIQRIPRGQQAIDEAGPGEHWREGANRFHRIAARQRKFDAAARKRCRPEACGSGKQSPRRPTLDQMDGDHDA